MKTAILSWFAVTGMVLMVVFLLVLALAKHCFPTLFTKWWEEWEGAIRHRIDDCVMSIREW